MEKIIAVRFLARASVPAFVACLLAAGMALAAEKFVSAISDLPLMPGLEEVDGSAMVFSKPQGRIVDVTASGSVTSDAVRAFYDDTLPQLGWRRHSAGGWQRENELLRFDMRREKNELVVRFSLTPR